MVVFLIIVAVLAVLIIALLSLSATFTIIYDKGWKTTIKVLFFEKEISISELLSMLLFPEKKAQDVADKKAEETAEKTAEPEQKAELPIEPEAAQTDNKQETASTENKQETQTSADDKKAEKPAKPNPIKKMWDEEGIVGILSFASNLLQTANSAIINLIRGLHIYSLYVMIIVGGDDAAQIAHSYGILCSQYYPVKGLILSGMRVDNYDDVIAPDFIAPRNEYEFQLIGSISVGALLKAVLKAGIVFVKNLIKNKKENKKV